MLDSDESELSSEGEEEGGEEGGAQASGHSSMGRMRFEVDDGRPNDGAFRGPTSSAAAATLALQLVDDDMDTSASARRSGPRQTYAQAYATAVAAEEAGVAPLSLRDDDDNSVNQRDGRTAATAPSSLLPSSSPTAAPLPSPHDDHRAHPDRHPARALIHTAGAAICID